MYRWIAVFALFCTSISLAEVKSQFYKFGDCVGHETICEDEFNEVIILSIDDSGMFTGNCLPLIIALVPMKEILVPSYIKNPFCKRVLCSGVSRSEFSRDSQISKPTSGEKGIETIGSIDAGNLAQLQNFVSVK